MPHVLGICGSLQARSSNLDLLRALQAAAPQGTDLTMFEGLAELPPFNPDDDDVASPALAELRRAVTAADGVVVASPEYAHGYPGVLKNALDWLVGTGELYGKPVVVLNAAKIDSRGQVARETLSEVLRVQGGDVRRSVTVVSQPEGGFAPEDLQAVFDALGPG